jgi:hypothetical protein
LYALTLALNSEIFKEALMDMDDDKSKAEDDSASSLKSDLARARLGLVVHYMMLGFAPVVAVLALILAVIAVIGNQSNREQLSEVTSQIKSLDASLSESKGELDLFKVPLAHEKTMLAEERKKQGERETKIIKSVTQLQTRMKIAPTLEEQFREITSAPSVPVSGVSAPAATSSIASPAAAPVAAPLPTVVEKKSAVVPKDTDKKPSAVSQGTANKPAAVQKNTAKKPAAVPKNTAKKPVAVQKDTDKKPSKVQSLKEAIEEFNRNDRK